MKRSRHIAVLLMLMIFTTLTALGVRYFKGTPASHLNKDLAKPEPLSRIDARIEKAQEAIKNAPDRADGYNQLAAAYMQKARESGDFTVNYRAEGVLARVAEIAPDDYDAMKLRAKLLLTFHRFEEGISEAQRAQRINPNDHDVYGALTDGYVELGRYKEAIAAAQKMVDLRPDAISYSRVAYLRSLHGDTEGAIAAMEVAVKAADPRDAEGLAWYRVHLGDELSRAGRLAEAEAQYDKALALFPGHNLAIQAKAHARAAAGDYDAAIELYKQATSHDALLALGDIYAKLGRKDESQRMYSDFEKAERIVAAQENDMSHLAKFWAERGQNLDEALQIMRRARERRADIYTCDTLAWVLFKSGQLAEAKIAIKDALRLGTHDAQINHHAEMIYNALGEKALAARAGR